MIARIINEVVTEFNEVRKENGTPTIQTEVVYAKRAVEFNGVTPRVVWSIGNFNITPTVKVGTNPHQGHSMDLEVVAHCFANTQDDLLFLINDVLAASRIILCEPAVKAGRGELLDPGESMQNGFGCRFIMTWSINVFDPGLKYVKVVASNPQTNEVVTTQSASFVQIQPQF